MASMMSILVIFSSISILGEQSTSKTKGPRLERMRSTMAKFNFNALAARKAIFCSYGVRSITVLIAKACDRLP